MRIRVTPIAPVSRRARLIEHVSVFLVAAAFVAAVTRIGIAARGGEELSLFFPTNAALVGAMVLVPRLRTPAGWLGALLGYYVADLTTGGAFELTTWLTIGNMAGVIVGVALLCRIAPEHRRLTRPLSVLIVTGVCAVAAVAATLPGIYTGSHYFGMARPEAAVIWFSTEATIFLALLPPILASQDRRKGLRRWDTQWRAGERAPVVLLDLVGPWVLLAVSLLVGSLIEGQLSVTFALPALLWCALRGRVLETALMVLVTNIWYLLAVGLEYYDDVLSVGGIEVSASVTVQFAMAMVSVAVILVAVSTHERVGMLEQMELLASRDPLTGLLNRRSFLAQGQHAIDSMTSDNRGVAVLMLDLDNFKGINDRYGHAVGDKLLVATANTLTHQLRDVDIIGRLGGEEFTVVISGITQDSARALGDLLRVAVAETMVDIGDATEVEVGVTVSIGVTHIGRNHEPHGSILELLEQADAALYAAKQLGRDRVILSPTSADFGLG